MLRFDPNISVMFREYEFLDRFAAAAAAGFRGVECVSPFEYPAEEIARLLRLYSLDFVMCNSASGDRTAGFLGYGAIKGCEEKFEAAVRQGIAYASVLGNRKFNVHAGIIPAEAERASARKLFVENLRRASAWAAEAGVTLMVENLNEYDMPGYLLMSTQDAQQIIDDVGSSQVKLEFDIYHCQLMEGNVAARLRALKDYIAHIQIAGVPGRAEPDIGELNYRFLFDVIEEIGYSDYVGLAYRPRGNTQQGLRWLEALTGRASQ